MYEILHHSMITVLRISNGSTVLLEVREGEVDLRGSSGSGGEEFRVQGTYCPPLNGCRLKLLHN